MLLDQRFTMSKRLWWVIIFGHALILISEWDFIDNHKYLSSYWMLACGLSLYFENTQEAKEMLAKNARWLIGLCFSFATFWKIIGGQFLDGSFLHYTFLTDGRFEFAVGYITNITRDILPANKMMVSHLQDYVLVQNGATLVSPSFVKSMALYVSWWTLLIEGLVGLSFLLPDRFFLGRRRDIFNLTFILSTYTFVPVAGFNYILVLLGLSQLTPQQKKMGGAYILALIISEAKRIPFLDYLFYIYSQFIYHMN